MAKIFFNTPPIQNTIPCPKCKQNSGWTNADLRTIKTNEIKYLKCDNCNKKCIKVVPSWVFTNDIKK